jgi:hypothetical protein
MSDATSSQAKPPAQVTPPETPHAASALALQVGVVIVAALYFAREVLIPVTLAILLSFILAPLVALLRRAHLPRVPAVLLAAWAASSARRSPSLRPTSRSMRRPSRRK